jgi:Leucine-rich repeat (LRR) protein
MNKFVHLVNRYACNSDFGKFAGLQPDDYTFEINISAENDLLPLIRLRNLFVIRMYNTYSIPTGIPRYFPYCEQITELHCSHTKISSIPDTLINLRILECKNTLVKKIPKTLTKLKYLNCEYTNVVALPKELINLRVLYCSHSGIELVPSELNISLIVCSHTYRYDKKK